eukprot:TRINITY_DN26263_c0_g1_i1.p1 TRINITY_DN26263_c0_g1~~TRINITY_DN26263_c0_g1_i1.p1  ORF type:complete len:376 (+),score=63.81 TRINITY_DN26263_c0_g1_i1:169-1296(+)
MATAAGQSTLSSSRPRAPPSCVGPGKPHGEPKAKGFSWTQSLRAQALKEPRRLIGTMPKLRPMELPPLTGMVPSQKDTTAACGFVTTADVTNDALFLKQAVASAAMDEDSPNGNLLLSASLSAQGYPPKSNLSKAASPKIPQGAESRQTLGENSSTGFGDTMRFWKTYSEHKAQSVRRRHPAWHEAAVHDMDLTEGTTPGASATSGAASSQPSAQKGSPRNAKPSRFPTDELIDAPRALAEEQAAVMREGRERLARMLRAGQHALVREETMRMMAASLPPGTSKVSSKQAPWDGSQSTGKRQKEAKEVAFRMPQTHEEEVAAGVSLAIKSMAAQRKEIVEMRSKLSATLALDVNRKGKDVRLNFLTKQFSTRLRA